MNIHPQLRLGASERQAAREAGDRRVVGLSTTLARMALALPGGAERYRSGLQAVMTELAKGPAGIPAATTAAYASMKRPPDDSDQASAVLAAVGLLLNFNDLATLVQQQCAATYAAACRMVVNPRPGVIKDEDVAMVRESCARAIEDGTVRGLTAAGAAAPDSAAAFMDAGGTAPALPPVPSQLGLVAWLSALGEVDGNELVKRSEGRLTAEHAALFAYLKLWLAELLLSRGRWDAEQAAAKPGH